MTSDASSSSSQANSSQRTASDRLYPDAITTTGDEIGRKESKAVWRARLFLIKVLFLSALALAVGTFTHLANKEETDFQRAFADQSSRMISAVGNEIATMFAATDDFCTTVLSLVQADGRQSWPFVVVPDFAVLAAKAISFSDTFFVAIHPVVNASQFDAWANFTSQNNAWLDEAIGVQATDKNFRGKIVTDWLPTDAIQTFGGKLVEAATVELAAPQWQSYPAVPSSSSYGFDLNSLSPNEVTEVLETKRVVLGATRNVDGNNNSSTAWAEGLVGYPASEPFAIYYYPLIEGSRERIQFDETLPNSIVGVMTGAFFWRDILRGHLPSEAVGLIVEVENDCGQSFSYRIDGSEATYLGTGDMQERKHSSLSKSVLLTDLKAVSAQSSGYIGAPMSPSLCQHRLSIYASSAMRDIFLTNQPMNFTIAVIVIFLFTSFVFFIYDVQVERRQQRVLRTATQSSAIVSSLFPSNVRDRLYAIQQPPQEAAFLEKKQKLRHYLAGMNVEMNETVEDSDEYAYGSKPIADLFPETTILFADLVGFTAWSSTREPSQVFQLLESIFKEFDAIAKRRRIFKVETVGDCYVAVVGLPDPRKDHAVAMARFALDCMNKFHLILPKLEIILGPDTADLAMRMGVHSGSVTAGVLRGERSRFQLFGDAMNTASRMETTSSASRIQVSEETADLLNLAGKGNWITAREGTVSVKGKGEMKTFWLHNRTYSRSSHGGSSNGDDTNRTVDEFSSMDFPSLQKSDRLIKWNVEIMLRLLKKMNSRTSMKTLSTMRIAVDESRHDQTCLAMSEAVEVIRLPEFNRRLVGYDKPLGPEVEQELGMFVGCIASMYNDCCFHGFEHASHVVMSVTKLLSRIVAPTDLEIKEGHAVDSLLHDTTFGITSDPLTQFSVVFSALCHDVGHVGVPNTQLVKEQPHLVQTFGIKSVAERNSINLAWHLLMESRFSNLRAAIYHNDEEKTRFKQLIVNSVLATDIVDKELKELRNSRWQKAFSPRLEVDADNVHRKATIVIEHLIQASDVAHTMQHWIVFRKWNERLFLEMYKAFLEGRADKDPAEFWYQGEIGFFDYYIIPLAKKLKDCGVFGVSSDEYLQYAVQNREEWVLKGREVVASMISRAKHRPWGAGSADDDATLHQESHHNDEGIEESYSEYLSI